MEKLPKAPGTAAMILSAVVLVAVAAFLAAGCAKNRAVAEAAAGTDSKYAAKPVAEGV